MRLNKLTELIAKSAGLAALATAVVSANALVVDFYNGASIYATMTTTGATDFSLSFTGTGSSGAFINELAMLGVNGTFLNTTLASITTVTGTFGAFIDQGDSFNWDIDFPQANGSSRFTTGETATWSITPTDNSIWNFNKIHINAFDGQNSIKIDGCVRGTPGCDGSDPPVVIPEPASLALVGLALSCAGIASRRRRSA